MEVPLSTSCAACVRAGPSLSRVVAAFAAIYLVWGSTYLAIRIANETVPPFLMAAARFILAGGILLLWLRRSIHDWPSTAGWTNATLVGGLLLLVFYAGMHHTQVLQMIRGWFG